MTESILYREAVQRGEQNGDLRTKRADLLFLVEEKFGTGVPEESLQLIRAQESLDLLHTWYRAVVKSSTAEQFLAALRL